MSKIKICGIKRREDAAIISEARPDYFGMIIDFPPSHRSISPETALMIRQLIPSDIPAVGVFVDRPQEEIKEMLESGAIDIAQLHGSESDETIRSLQKDTGKPIWKAFKIREKSDLERAMASSADMILLDNGYGTGKCFDWTLVSTVNRPFALAGGLTPQNIPEAIRLMDPEVLDISSGVETDKVKDKEKVLRAVRAARSTQKG